MRTEEIYCVTFAFQMGEFNEGFHRLDERIAEYTKQSMSHNELSPCDVRDQKVNPNNT